MAAIQGSDNSEVELENRDDLELVRIKRPRGRPKKRIPLDFRRYPALRVIPDRYVCLCCASTEATLC